MEFQHFEQFLCHRLTFEDVFFLYEINGDIIELKGKLDTVDKWGGIYKFTTRQKYINADRDLVLYHESKFHFKNVRKLIKLNSLYVNEIKAWFNKINPNGLYLIQ